MISEKKLLSYFMNAIQRSLILSKGPLPGKHEDTLPEHI